MVRSPSSSEPRAQPAALDVGWCEGWEQKAVRWEGLPAPQNITLLPGMRRGYYWGRRRRRTRRRQLSQRLCTPPPPNCAAPDEFLFFLRVLFCLELLSPYTLVMVARTSVCTTRDSSNSPSSSAIKLSRVGGRLTKTFRNLNMMCVQFGI